MNRMMFKTAACLLLLSVAGGAQARGFDTGNEIIGPKAPPPDVPVVVTSDDHEQPYAFADFPDLPGLLPPAPPDKDRLASTVPTLTPVDDDITRFGGPKTPPPPDAGQVLLPNFPGWADPFDAGRDLPSDLGPRFSVDTRVSASPAVPAPGPLGALLVAGSVLAGRRRR